MNVIVYGCTDQGQVRERNEDNYYIPGWPGKDPAGMPECFDTDKCILLAVADGMGGHAGGDVASKIVIDELDKGIQSLQEENTDHLKKAGELIVSAHLAILEGARANPYLSGMGSTICALLFKDDFATPLHVGDSRAYLYRNGIMGQLTRDHSEIQVLIELGLIASEEARYHPRKGIILKNLGSEPRYGKFEVETSEELKLREGDIFLICSDGLTDMLDDSEIRKIIMETREEPLSVLSQAASRLIEEANSKGGFDNITVILAVVEKEPVASADDHQSEEDSSKKEDIIQHNHTQENFNDDSLSEQSMTGKDVLQDRSSVFENNTGARVNLSYDNIPGNRSKTAEKCKALLTAWRVKK